METYLKKGYSKEWVNQSLKNIEVKKDLTNEWDKRGVKKDKNMLFLQMKSQKPGAVYQSKNTKIKKKKIYVIT